MREVSHSVLKLGSSPSPKLGSSKKVDEGVPSQNPLELAFGLVILTRPNFVRRLAKELTALNPQGRFRAKTQQFEYFKGFLLKAKT